MFLQRIKINQENARSFKFPSSCCYHSVPLTNVLVVVAAAAAAAAAPAAAPAAAAVAGVEVVTVGMVKAMA